LIWAEPRAEGQRKLVIWLPGFSGEKEALIPQLQELADQGYVALSYDPYQHGQRRIETNDELRVRIHGNIRRYFWPILGRTATDASTVVDWAIEHLSVASQVGMGGISMGGDVSVAAAGLDQRIVAIAACIATPDWLRPGSFEPPGMPDDEAQAWYERCNPLTHLNHYHHCPAITFQCGADDRQVPPDGAQRFARALSAIYSGDPQRMNVTLEPGTAHICSRAMWQYTLSWFQRYL